MSEPKAKRFIMLDLINKGGATKASLMQAAGLSVASFGTNMAYLRMMGHYPVTDKDGVYSIVTQDEYEERRMRKAEASAAKVSSARTPEERYAAVVKRAAKAAKAYTAASDRADKDTSELAQLRMERAALDLRIAQIELEATPVPEGYDADADTDADDLEPEEL